MSKKKNGLPYHFRLKPKLLKKFEKAVRRRGFSSRTEHFTDAA